MSDVEADRRHGATDAVATDVLAVTQTIARIAALADMGEVSEYATLFDEDATWRMPANPAVGMSAQYLQGRGTIRDAALARRAAGIQGPGTNTRHIVTNTAVDVDGDRAHAVSYFQFVTSTSTSPVLASIGAYDDAFRRCGTAWLLTHRIITIG